MSSPYRKPGEVIEFRGKPQFLDERCAACDHPKDSHYGGVEKCYRCEVERVCQRFVLKEQAN